MNGTKRRGSIRDRLLAGLPGYDEPHPADEHVERRVPPRIVAQRPYRLDDELPFALDLEAQRFVDEHPDGASLDEIGKALGLTRERIRQIETIALRKLRKRIALGIGLVREVFEP